MISSINSYNSTYYCYTKTSIDRIKCVKYDNNPDTTAEVASYLSDKCPKYATSEMNSAKIKGVA